MLALVSLQGRIRPIAVAGADDDGYLVVRLSARIAGFRWEELSGTAPALARRTTVIPGGVEVPRSAALMVLGWLSGADQDQISQAIETGDLAAGVQ